MSRLSQLLQYGFIGVTTIGLSILAVQSVPSLADVIKPNPVKPAPATKPPVLEFRVGGTEPFWGMTIAQKGIVYQTPLNKPVKYPYVAPISAEGRTLESTLVYRFGSNRDTLILKKAQGFCSDGMSDNEYPYSATLIRGKQVFDGCAEPLSTPPSNQ